MLKLFWPVLILKWRILDIIGKRQGILFKLTQLLSYLASFNERRASCQTRAIHFLAPNCKQGGTNLLTLAEIVFVITNILFCKYLMLFPVRKVAPLQLIPSRTALFSPLIQISGLKAVSNEWLSE